MEKKEATGQKEQPGGSVRVGEREKPHEKLNVEGIEKAKEGSGPINTPRDRSWPATTIKTNPPTPKILMGIKVRIWSGIALLPEETASLAGLS